MSGHDSVVPIRRKRSGALAPERDRKTTGSEFRHEVSGHDFSRADAAAERSGALAPVMARPSRPSDPKNATGQSRTFFLTTRTAGSRPLFQTVRMAELFIDVLRHYVRLGKFEIHDFVVMPNHVHILLTIQGDVSLEKTMQWIKGGFSFRAKRELGLKAIFGSAAFPTFVLSTNLVFRIIELILTTIR